tara:strand:- start:850 stop:1191 length:342 start_codon:yes stop_codon:yes gene_type:complete
MSVTNTITWGFQSETPLESLANDPNKGLVIRVHWNITCHSSDGFTGYHFDVMSFEKGSTVIPYEDLTKNTILGWIKTKLGSDEVSRLESMVKDLCDQQRAPQEIIGAPSSWSS